MQNTKTTFLKHVNEHVMTVENDSGVFRSILFKRPGCSAFYFRLVTWPGHLAVSGDMGDYIFARLDDMFEFFRRNDLAINYGYWQEKLKASSRFGAARNGGWEEYDGKSTAASVWKYCRKGRTAAEFAELTEAIREAESESEFFRIASDNDIPDAHDYLHSKPTFHIQWIMHAIVWGIQKYDLKTKIAEAA